MKQSNIEKLGVQGRVACLPLCSCGIGRRVFNKIITNTSTQKNVVLTWFIKGNGTFRQEDNEYVLSDYCVCLRNADIPFSMHLEDDEGPRLFLSMTLELFDFINVLIPELKQMPPVWSCPFSQETFDAFFTFFEHIQQTSSLDFYKVIPDLVRYILCVTGIQHKRGVAAIEKGRLFLEDNQILSLEEIARKCDMSYHTFRRQFRKKYGISPGKYRIQKRIDMAANWLKQGMSVNETSELMGYPDIYSFSHRFKTEKGMSPVRYRLEHIEDKDTLDNET